MTPDAFDESAHYEHRLVDNLHSMLAYWDSNLRCRFANQACRQWFGVDPRSLPGTSLQELLGPELFALDEPYIRGALRGEEQTFVRSLVLANGSRREIVASYVPDMVDGIVAGILVQVMDVTSLNRLHGALRLHEEYRHELFALSHEGIVITDDAGQYLDVNDAFCRMVGYEREEVLGMSFDALVMPTELARLQQARASLRTGAEHAEEWMLRRKDGTALPAEVRAKMLSNGRHVGFLLDISDHRRALKAERTLSEELERQVAARTAELLRTTHRVRVSEASLRGIFESASEGIVTTDAAQRIVAANPAAAAMFHCSIEQLVGAPLERFIPARHRKNHARRVQDFGLGVTSPASMNQREVTALRADGVEFPIEASISRATVDSQTFFTVVVRDVSEHKRILASLQSAHEQLHQLVAAMDTVQEDERKRIAREVHDELQQTLAAINLNAAAIGDEARRSLSKADRHLLSEIESLASAAIESTRRIVSDLRPRVLEDLGLVSALDAMARAFGRRHDIACHFDAAMAVDLDPRDNPSITTCLFRVAQEALNNVARHAHATRVDITLQSQGGDSIVLRVRDDGVGLQTADRRKPGSFGLMGIDERVRAVGGVVNVLPSPDGGTCVEVIVPLAGRPAGAPRPAQPAVRGHATDP